MWFFKKKKWTRFIFKLSWPNFKGSEGTMHFIQNPCVISYSCIPFWTTIGKWLGNLSWPMCCLALTSPMGAKPLRGDFKAPLPFSASKSNPVCNVPCCIDNEKGRLQSLPMPPSHCDPFLERRTPSRSKLWTSWFQNHLEQTLILKVSYWHSLRKGKEGRMEIFLEKNGK